MVQAVSTDEIIYVVTGIMAPGYDPESIPGAA